jgi:hypothetical protein
MEYLMNVPQSLGDSVSSEPRLEPDRRLRKLPHKFLVQAPNIRPLIQSQTPVLRELGLFIEPENSTIRVGKKGYQYTLDCPPPDL